MILNIGCCNYITMTIASTTRYFAKNTGSSSYYDTAYAWRSLAFNFWWVQVKDMSSLYLPFDVRLIACYWKNTLYKDILSISKYFFLNSNRLYEIFNISLKIELIEERTKSSFRICVSVAKFLVHDWVEIL